MWIVAVSICSAITLVVVLAMCSCWKRQQHKDDWLGLDGMVKQKNPDENVNHIPLPAAAVSLQVIPECTTNVAADTEQTTILELNKWPVVQTNNTRRSLPDIPSEGQVLAVREGWDANGDNSSELYATVEPYNNAGGKRHTLPNGLDPRPCISQHSSISQADDAFSPYASVNYDKLPPVEHPYAIVKPPTANNEELHAEPTVRTSLLSTEANGNEPHAPPRSRRTSEQSNHVDINAASAVAGGIAASQDLPYMTPPINPSTQQVNFSGDSQDSSKGYTSISVREPLANIIAQTKDMQKAKRVLDPHYSTVSDDSDEMYTTIPDALNQEYTSGSETYAQIQPVALTVAADIYPVPSNLQSIPTETTPSINMDNSIPQPPSVDILKNMTNSHSRQDGELFAASSSSSILNLGSPKPEKRQANSPLPPPPPATSSTAQLTLSPDNARRNLDEMYAKVQKNRKKSADDVANRRSTSSTSSSEEKRPDDGGAQAKLHREHNYETLKKSSKKSASDGYEELKAFALAEPGYVSINGPDSLNYDDPNYEQLKESVADVGYSVINKQGKKKPADEPNYESMPASESDPNYESVHHTEPNYESVKYLDVDGGYERLHQTDDDTDSGATSATNKTDNKSGYETIASATSSNKSRSPPYEKLHDEDGKTDSESSGYERVDKSSSLEERSRSNDDYETIKNDLTDCLGDENAIFEV